MKTIAPAEAVRLVEQGATLVDIREPGEVARLAIPGAVNLPLSRLDAPEPVLPRGRKVLFICASGGRTGMHAARLEARAKGCQPAIVAGGIAAWRGAGLPVVAQAGGASALPAMTLAMLAMAGGALGVLVSPWFFAIPVALAAGGLLPLLRRG